MYVKCTPHTKTFMADCTLGGLLNTFLATGAPRLNNWPACSLCKKPIYQSLSTAERAPEAYGLTYT